MEKEDNCSLTPVWSICRDRETGKLSLWDSDDLEEISDGGRNNMEWIKSFHVPLELREAIVRSESFDEIWRLIELVLNG